MALPSHRTETANLDEVLNIDIEVIVAQVETNGLDWADRDGAANLLEESKKSLLAELQNQFQKGQSATGGKPMPVSQAESLALADQRYREHCVSMVNARTASNRARVKYDTGRARLDMLRSQLATRREEMRLGGMRT